MLNRIKVISFKGEKDKCPMYNVKNLPKKEGLKFGFRIMY